MRKDGIIAFGITLERGVELSDKISLEFEEKIYKSFDTLDLKNLSEVISEGSYLKTAMDQAETRAELLSVLSMAGSMHAILKADHPYGQKHLNNMIDNATTRKLKEILK